MTRCSNRYSKFLYTLLTTSTNLCFVCTSTRTGVFPSVWRPQNVSWRRFSAKKSFVCPM